MCVCVRVCVYDRDVWQLMEHLRGRIVIGEREALQVDAAMAKMEAHAGPPAHSDASAVSVPFTVTSYPESHFVEKVDSDFICTICTKVAFEPPNLACGQSTSYSVCYPRMDAEAKVNDQSAQLTDLIFSRHACPELNISCSGHLFCKSCLTEWKNNTCPNINCAVGLQLQTPPCGDVIDHVDNHALTGVSSDSPRPFCSASLAIETVRCVGSGLSEWLRCQQDRAAEGAMCTPYGRMSGHIRNRNGQSWHHQP
jgi:hypothetical protein